MAQAGCCRICFDSVDDDVLPVCSCNSRAHQTCVQTWIQIRGEQTEESNADLSRCEVCAQPWRGDFSIPQSEERRQPKSQEELLSGIFGALERAHLRVTVSSLTPSAGDLEILREFASVLPQRT